MTARQLARQETRQPVISQGRPTRGQVSFCELLVSSSAGLSSYGSSSAYLPSYWLTWGCLQTTTWRIAPRANFAIPVLSRLQSSEIPTATLCYSQLDSSLAQRSSALIHSKNFSRRHESETSQIAEQFLATIGALPVDFPSFWQSHELRAYRYSFTATRDNIGCRNLPSWLQLQILIGMRQSHSPLMQNRVCVSFANQQLILPCFVCTLTTESAFRQLPQLFCES